MLQLQAADGHTLDAYRADPADAAKGGIVVIQDAFGVNEQLRAVCDRYAAHGYAAAAPALYDRQQRNAAFDYDDDSAARARAMRAKIQYDQVMLDVAAAFAALRGSGRVGVVGYCVGGSAAWLAACRLDMAAASCYYPTDIGKQYQERPRCPVILHFGEIDELIPLSQVEALRAEQPLLPVYLYPAEHGFNNPLRASTYHEPSAKLALERTLGFFDEHIARR
jgi:carboxymethylenebutenolidase